MAAPRTKRTEERAKIILQAIEVGLTYELAAKSAGISEDTFSRWRKSDADFAERIDQAEGRGALVNMARIQKEAKEGDWRAAAWILEHRYPEAYGAKATLKHEGDPDKPVRHEHTVKVADFSALSLTEQFDLDQMLAKVEAGGDHGE